MTEHVVIVGAGLGGLECGYILAKNGMRVTVLEQAAQVGGCLQSFQRGSVVFDSGFHYVGGLREGESLHRLFKYFDLLSLPWHQLDEDCFDEVVIDGCSYPFATGHERFVKTLSGYFPDEKAGLQLYTNTLRGVGEHIYDIFEQRESSVYYCNTLFERSAYDFINDTIGDPLLRRVLAGTSLKMELKRKTLPLYVFAQINNSYLESAWRLHGGGQQIADHLAMSIRQMGGNIHTNTVVTSINEMTDHSLVITTAKGETFSADRVICDIHPVSALQLMRDCKSVKKYYRRRIDSLENTFGMFTANIRLKMDNNMEYLNRNLFIHDNDTDLWDVDTSSPRSVMVSFYHQQPAVDLLTPLRWSQVAKWSCTEAGSRGNDYVAYKQQLVEGCLRVVEKRLPQLRDSIDRIFTSTPLTYYRQTLLYKGSAYGVQKDWMSPETTILSPRTPVRNVLLTGQNLNLHGVLGVSLTSMLTCKQILGNSLVF